MDQVAHGPTDDQFMDEALVLARRALGRTAPNPAVGAVVVRNDAIVGQGWTRPPGGPHAEAVALAEAGGRAAGATLYVTLEPCCHHGRTPPCADAIIAAGIARCVVAVADPFPLVNGGGVSRLREAGIAVAVGVGAVEASSLNEGYFTRIRTGRPMVIAKYAMTLDGRIATRTGQSRWITGEESRVSAQILRDQADAIMVGTGTVRLDDPLLTTRLPAELAGDGGPHHPLRIVIDGRGTTPRAARVFDPALPGKTLVATTASALPDWRAALAPGGVEQVTAGDGPLVDLGGLLDHLGGRGINSLLVEGGSRLHGSLFDAKLVDRVAAFIAPVVVGGRDAPGPVGGYGVATMSAAWQLRDVTLQRLGDDLLLQGRVDTSGPDREGA
ncbi:MAG: diaminohydroxyphosphoribosylaminopyrimidine deaminase [Thermomicrobiales bacterium]|jgi:diaminohydroxyphosphoribosylaminopyrimidine deaminase/5-amino-6-(5-phosphoribosylamino)uracil reductase|nr:diaminohydroxyphosphoribosylaminopyrimidine deaminase [Thermomicrobiales bacterium]